MYRSRRLRIDTLEMRALMASDFEVDLNPQTLDTNPVLASGDSRFAAFDQFAHDDVSPEYTEAYPYHRLITFFMRSDYTLDLTVVNLRTGMAVLPASEVWQGDLLELKFEGERADFVTRGMSELASDPHFELVEGRTDLIKVTKSGTFQIEFVPNLDAIGGAIVQLTGKSPAFFRPQLQELLSSFSRTVNVRANSARPSATDETYWYAPFDGLETARDVAALLTRPEALTLSIDASQGVLKNAAGPLRAVTIAGPSRGTLVLNADGSFDYAVHHMSYDNSLYDFIKSGDKFTYALISPQGMSDVHTVRIQGASVPMLDLKMQVVDMSGQKVSSLSVGQEFYLEVSAYSNNIYRVAIPYYQTIHPLQFSYNMNGAGASFLGAPSTPERFKRERYSLGQENGLLVLNSEMVGPRFTIEQLQIQANFDMYALDIEETVLLRQKMIGTQAGQLNFTIDQAFLSLENVNVEAIHVDGTSLQLTSDAMASESLTNPLDVSGNGEVSPLDVLLIVNRLNSSIEAEISFVADSSLPPIDYDVNHDGSVSALDALLVINWLNTQEHTSAEGEKQALSGSPDAIDQMLFEEQTIKRSRSAMRYSKT